MPRRISEAAVTEFLAHALGAHATGVLELEAMARAVGLLGKDQSITHLKAFKRAKKSLGIRSIRAGIGGRRHWLWELPGQTESPPRLKRQPLAVRRIPIEWIEGVERLEAEPSGGAQ